MADTYLKVAVNTIRHLYYQDPITGAPVTGVAAGSFTVQITKDGTGNQATTGITGPTEVDATNNAGLYKLTCSGATSFVATTGIYEIKVFVTATNSLVWNETVIVTSDGTGAGTFGAASFTAVASNGRVMSGGSPLAGATVTITTPTGAIYTQLTSDASGLWGPVYFNSNGTYGVQVQKTGYTTTSSTIVVSGSTATGPGADLTITAVTTGSVLLASTWMSYLRRVLLDASSSKADTIILEVLNEAQELYFMETQNPFWQRDGGFELQAPYATGTLTLTNGSDTVNFSGATLPAWVDAGCDIFLPASGVWFRILTRDSNSQVTITRDYEGTTTAGLEYSLSKIRYQLPSDCAKTNDLLFGAQWPYQTYMTSAAKLEMLKDAWQQTNSITCMWAIERDYVCVWPPPQIERTVNFMYFAKPAQITSGSDTLDWPSDQILVLRRALDYCASLRGSTVSGGIDKARQAYQEAKAMALNWDKTTAQISPEQPNQIFGGNGGINSIGWDGTVTTI